MFIRPTLSIFLALHLLLRIPEYFQVIKPLKCSFMVASYSVASNKSVRPLYFTDVSLFFSLITLSHASENRYP